MDKPLRQSRTFIHFDDSFNGSVSVVIVSISPSSISLHSELNLNEDWIGALMSPPSLTTRSKTRASTRVNQAFAVTTSLPL